MSAHTLLVLLIAGSAVICAMILALAPGRPRWRSREQAPSPPSPPGALHAAVAGVMPEIRAWFRNARADVAVDRLAALDLFQVVMAYHAIESMRPDLVTEILDGIVALPRPSRARLVQAAMTTIRIREGADGLVPGHLRLDEVGYEERTRTFELSAHFTGSVVDRCDPPGHLDRLRALVASRQDPEGRPIDTVRVVFLHEWLALRERKPLVAAGAKVCFTDPNSGELVEVVERGGAKRAVDGA